MNRMLHINPAVTVLMSVFNGERWLHESIRSVLTQSFRDFEFIIINDGSTDKSLEIIKSFALDDNRIVVIDKPNSGLADSLNCGIAQAKGEWIARLDADDVCEPIRLERQFELAMTNPDVVLVGSWLRIIDETGREGKTYRLPVEHEALLRRLLRMQAFLAHSSACYKTEVVRRVGGYRPRIKRAQDSDLWLRLSEHGKFVCVDEPLIKHRIHAAQISYDESGQRQFIDSRVAAISYWLRRFGKTDPVDASIPEEEFQRFREWVALKLKDNNKLAYHEFMRTIRQQRRIDAKILGGSSRIIFLALEKPLFILRYLAEKLVGEHLALRLAKEWIALEANRPRRIHHHSTNL